MSSSFMSMGASPTADCFRILVGIQDSPRRGHFSTTPSRPNEHTAQNGRNAGFSNFTTNLQYRVDARRFSACAARRIVARLRARYAGNGAPALTS